MKKILILDDDLVYLRLVCRILTSRGYKVRQASHHAEFFSQLEGEEPQLVMLDINMPEKDGFQVYRELMAQHTIPVLFVTGYPASFNLALDSVWQPWQTHVAEGQTDILYKPFRMGNLARKVEGLIGAGQPKETTTPPATERLAIIRRVRQTLVRYGVDLGRLFVGYDGHSLVLDGPVTMLPGASVAGCGSLSMPALVETLVALPGVGDVVVRAMPQGQKADCGAAWH